MSTKIHLSVGYAGVVSCHLSPGQTADCKAIENLWEHWPWHTIRAVVGDKGYASSTIRNTIRSHGAQAVIPHKGLWLAQDKEGSSFPHPNLQAIYAKRHFIERLFAKLKENKRLASRFDKLDVSFLAFVALALIFAFQLLC
jgi:transposase